MPNRYPPEFRRKVLDLLAAGRSVACRGFGVETRQDQLANAPDLKWLAVGLSGHSASQLNDHFGPETSPPYSFEPVNGLTLGCFDEVWVLAPCGKEMYTVVRLAQQSRHIVRLTSEKASPQSALAKCRTRVAGSTSAQTSSSAIRNRPESGGS